MRVSEFSIKSIDGLYVFFESSKALLGLRCHNTGILCLLLLLGLFWGFPCAFAFILLLLRLSYLPGRSTLMCLFDTAHFEFWIEIFKNFRNVPCLKLHPPRAVVCRPRQTRVDVHVLVVIIQGYCFSNMPCQELEQKLLPKKKSLLKNR